MGVGAVHDAAARQGLPLITRERAGVCMQTRARSYTHAHSETGLSMQAAYLRIRRALAYGCKQLCACTMLDRTATPGDSSAAVDAIDAWLALESDAAQASAHTGGGADAALEEPGAYESPFFAYTHRRAMQQRAAALSARALAAETTVAAASDGMRARTKAARALKFPDVEVESDPEGRAVAPELAAAKALAAVVVPSEGSEVRELAAAAAAVVGGTGGSEGDLCGDSVQAACADHAMPLPTPSAVEQARCHLAVPPSLRPRPTLGLASPMARHGKKSTRLARSLA